MKASKKQRRQWFWLGTIIVLLVLGVLIGYSVAYYLQSEVEETGVDVCVGEVCSRSIHIHADLSGSICGQAINLTKEQGPLTEAHTHKEKNLLHFHNTLQFDRQTNRVLDYGPLALKKSLADLDMVLPETCLGSDQAAKLQLKVNDKIVAAGLDYIWQDGDELELIY